MKRLNHKRVAEGEVTGHCHEAVDKDAVLYGDSNDVPVRLNAPSGSDIKHQEHGQVRLPPGDYGISRVKEWDHAAEEAREVIE
jgi:hypothetical protein